MAERLSPITSSTGRDSRLARPSSRLRSRSVAIRPGRAILTVMPLGASSRDRVLDQPARAPRSEFDRARFGMGATTPDEAMVTIRPHPAARISGSTASVIAMRLITMPRKCVDQRSSGWPAAGDGGGPPVLFTSISIGPLFARISATRPAACSGSETSQTTWVVGPAIVAADAASTSGLLPTKTTWAPSAESARADAAPSPLPAPITSAVFPFMPKSMTRSTSVVACAQAKGRTPVSCYP